MTTSTPALTETRVVFGNGSFNNIADEVDRLGCSRVLVVTTPGRGSLGARARNQLGSRFIARFEDAVVHVPEAVAFAARNITSAARADCILALGGGSAIGVAKVIALTSGLPIIAVPTTYGGSEMTPIWGVTAQGQKKTGRNPKVKPQVVIYDPELTLGLPANISAASGMNAIAHCVEALYANDATAASNEMSRRGIQLLQDALPRIVADPTNLAARESALAGARLAGTALGTVQMALHHKLCHTLGGAFELPHAETHAVLLPYTAAFNRGAAPEAMKTAANALGADDCPTALLDLERTIVTPLSLEEIGMSSADLERAADLAVEREYPNPRPLARADILELLQAAFRGESAYVTSGVS